MPPNATARSRGQASGAQTESSAVTPPGSDPASASGSGAKSLPASPATPGSAGASNAAVVSAPAPTSDALVSVASPASGVAAPANPVASVPASAVATGAKTSLPLGATPSGSSVAPGPGPASGVAAA